MSKTESAVTAHGEVEYEIVECSSCQTELPKDDALWFVIGTGKTFRDSVAGVKNQGWACRHCADDPAEFPSGAPTFEFIEYFAEANIVDQAFIFTVLASVIASAAAAGALIAGNLLGVI